MCIKFKDKLAHSCYLSDSTIDFTTKWSFPNICILWWLVGATFCNPAIPTSTLFPLYFHSISTLFPLWTLTFFHSTSGTLNFRFHSVSTLLPFYFHTGFLLPLHFHPSTILLRIGGGDVESHIIGWLDVWVVPSSNLLSGLAYFLSRLPWLSYIAS